MGSQHILWELFRMCWGTVFISPSPRGEEILRRIEIVIRTCLGATPRRGELPDNGSDESICSQVWKQPPEGASFQTMDSWDAGINESQLSLFSWHGVP